MAGTTLTMTVVVGNGTGTTDGMTIDPAGDLYTFPEGGIDHGAQGWRRTTAESPWAEGRTVVAAVRDVAVGNIVIRVFGTLAEQKTRTASLIAAFSQIDHTVTINIDGTAHIWSNCEPAEYQISSTGTGLSGPHMMAGQQSVTFQVPHSPGFT